MKKLFYFLASSIFISNITLAGMSDPDKSKAWECSGIYMAKILTDELEVLKIIKL